MITTHPADPTLVTILVTAFIVLLIAGSIGAVLDAIARRAYADADTHFIGDWQPTSEYFTSKARGDRYDRYSTPPMIITLAAVLTCLVTGALLANQAIDITLLPGPPTTTQPTPH
ncbi:hypothetical protein AB0L97_34820 [Nocardia sp. NPDC051911]|uniref:hypothetical protein n=1 Tax=Nocardia sp. NPDC051911 TaxID=3154648 RepID=UPI003427BA13